MTEPGETIFQVELQHDSDGQFFNIPPELAFSTDEVILQREGNRLIITPAIQTALGNVKVNSVTQARSHTPAHD